MRDKITTALEVVGSLCFASGVGLRFGFDYSLMIIGVEMIFFGYLAA